MNSPYQSTDPACNWATDIMQYLSCPRNHRWVNDNDHLGTRGAARGAVHPITLVPSTKLPKLSNLGLISPGGTKQGSGSAKTTTDKVVDGRVVVCAFDIHCESQTIHTLIALVTMNTSGAATKPTASNGCWLPLFRKHCATLVARNNQPNTRIPTRPNKKRSSQA